MFTKLIHKHDKLNTVKGLKKINRGVESYFDRLLDFLKEYAVVGVAIGVIIGQASKDFVEITVNGVIMPLFNLLIPGQELNSLTIQIGSAQLDIGAALGSFLTLLIIISFVYFIVNRIVKRDKRREMREKE